jgi:hypothetical protein
VMFDSPISRWASMQPHVRHIGNSSIDPLLERRGSATRAAARMLWESCA